MKQISQEIQLQTAEVEANYKAFKKQLPGLMKTKDKGKYALMHNRQITQVFIDHNKATIAGIKKFQGKPFSVQHIDDTPIDLGIHSIY